MAIGRVTLVGPQTGDNIVDRLTSAGGRFLDAYVDHQVAKRFTFDDDPTQLTVDPNVDDRRERDPNETGKGLAGFSSTHVGIGVAALSALALVVVLRG